MPHSPFILLRNNIIRTLRVQCMIKNYHYFNYVIIKLNFLIKKISIFKSMWNNTWEFLIQRVRFNFLNVKKTRRILIISLY